MRPNDNPGPFRIRFLAVRVGRVALVVGIVVLALVPATASGARSQFGPESIHNYNVEVHIEPTGTVRIHETIDYDFGVIPKHGIFRDVPVRFDYPPKANHDRVYPLDVVSVQASEGTASQFTLESGDIDGVGVRRIKIGDPDRTISGRHTYDITYTLRGVLNGFDDHDELNLNAIGPGWTVPIDRATVTVDAPADITQVACFSGPLQSRLACGSADSSGPAATFTQSNMAPGAAFTVVVGIPKGVVPPPKPILEERFNLATAFSVTPATAGVGGGLLFVVLGGFALLMYRFGRDRRYRGSAVDQAFGSDGGAQEYVPVLHHEETPVEFVPPDNLRPGQLGTLVDFTANPLDVTATIVDLAVRGYLVIEEIPGSGGFLHKPDWKLTKKKGAGPELKDYEQKLLAGLFEDGNEVKLSDLQYTFAQRMNEVQKALTDDAMAQGWFVRPPSVARLQWGFLGVLVLLAGVGLTILLAIFTHAALLGIPVIIAGILLTFGAYWIPQRTAKGTGVLRRTEGFRRFINESEKERARFAEKKNLFSEYLPYAIVFGATGKWAAAFAGLDDQPPDTSSWYIASTAFTFIAFSSAIDGFTVSTSGTLTSTPPSTSGSSGFSGGGFSGGGAGG
ncbi:MAG: DUF2207 domain-containing protein, partial [Actinomycetota bacterium]|nr:DUF2207 domain-containing protein [Actinomycetota bacterium]